MAIVRNPVTGEELKVLYEYDDGYTKKDTDKTGSKAFGFAVFKEHTKDDTADGREEAVREGAVNEIFRMPGMENIKHFFIMVIKDVLKDYVFHS